MDFLPFAFLLKGRPLDLCNECTEFEKRFPKQRLPNGWLYCLKVVKTVKAVIQ